MRSLRGSILEYECLVVFGGYIVAMTAICIDLNIVEKHDAGQVIGNGFFGGGNCLSFFLLIPPFAITLTDFSPYSCCSALISQ